MNNMDPSRKRYIQTILGTRDQVLDQVLRKALLEEKLPPIQIDDNAGRILQLLTLLHKPMFVVEVGSFFGYSTIYIARGLPDKGRIVSLEIDSALAAIAHSNIVKAGLSEQAEIINMDALKYLDNLATNSIDMVFIDAEKKFYPEYLKVIAKKVRTGGVIIADDAFADNIFAEAEDENEAQIQGIHKYNLAMGKASTFFSTFIITETGLLVSIKK